MAPPNNPYLNRSMIRSVDEFHGRRRELQRILSRIGASTPQSVSIVGERRMGKSSLLWHLAQPQVHGAVVDDASRYLFVLFDFQGHQHLDQSACCQLLAQQICASAAGRLSPPADGDGGLEQLLAIAEAAAAADLRLVFLFDEFETVTRNEAIGSEFYGSLRSLANNHAVAFVTASRRPLQSLCHSREISESLFFNIFSEIRIGPMPDDEIHRLITEPSAQAGVPLAQYEEMIRHLGGNLPFFVQIACSASVECLAEGGTPDAARLGAAFLEEATGHFRFLWESWDDGERAAITAAARGDMVSDDTARLLQAQGFLVGEGADLRPFSAALVAFLRDPALASQAGADGTPPTSAEGFAPSMAAPARSRRRLRVAAGIVVVAITLVMGVTWTYQDQAAVTVAATVLSPARLEALGLSVEIQCESTSGAGLAPSILALGVDQPASSLDHNLHPGDRVRLGLATGQRLQAYLFLIDDSGRVEPVPTDASRPVTVTAGRLLLLPAGDGWFVIDGEGGDQQLIVVAADRRLGDLEDLLLRYQQADAIRLPALARSLASEIRSRGVVAVTLSGH